MVYTVRVPGGTCILRAGIPGTWYIPCTWCVSCENTYVSIMNPAPVLTILTMPYLVYTSSSTVPGTTAALVYTTVRTVVSTWYTGATAVRVHRQYSGAAVRVPVQQYAGTAVYALRVSAIRSFVRVFAAYYFYELVIWFRSACSLQPRTSNRAGEPHGRTRATVGWEGNQCSSNRFSDRLVSGCKSSAPCMQKTAPSTWLGWLLLPWVHETLFVGIYGQRIPPLTIAPNQQQPLWHRPLVSYSMVCQISSLGSRRRLLVCTQ